MRVIIYSKNGRIINAYKDDRTWVVPENIPGLTLHILTGQEVLDLEAKYPNLKGIEGEDISASKAITEHADEETELQKFYVSLAETAVEVEAYLLKVRLWSVMEGSIEPFKTIVGRYTNLFAVAFEANLPMTQRTVQGSVFSDDDLTSDTLSRKGVLELIKKYMANNKDIHGDNTKIQAWKTRLVITNNKIKAWADDGTGDNARILKHIASASSISTIERSGTASLRKYWQQVLEKEGAARFIGFSTQT